MCVLLILGLFPRVSSCVAFAKSRAEEIDRGYRVEACNSSALGKSAADTNAVTGGCTFVGFLCFSFDEMYVVM